MDRDISCCIIKDLLPNYVDRLTSEETNNIIENHLKTCSVCSKERDEMMEQVEIEQDTKAKNQSFKQYLSKTKMMYLLKGALLSFGIIGIIVTFIVDLAVNKRLSWSLIVDMGILYSYSVGLTAVMSKKQKGIKAFAVGSILVLPMLHGIEYVININYMTEPVSWFSRYALPITVIWLAILWITVLIKKIIKLNIWNVLGVLLIMTIFGSVLTDSIAQQISVKQVYTSGYEWIDSISYAACALLFFIIGTIRKNRNRLH
ncbi:zf-HC2 domain-containing protein [Anaerocolumna sp. MB42-C2]|uniref:zf-HC2 domain-containing protein n=1 Tax=Anaerocolumna sp. MB42-C2 TaxID=3070997 RepID=UPI0027DFD186|nr:zf-HC2 domain-containing protein [Anaerocolumna sp. MB42-C2]WMJ87432.1 zf-HC2 domain-containing protein [Anaerocolumna sp. MB42-C2]